MSDTPIHRLQVAHVQAIRLSGDGEGVAILNGMTVFVPNLLPGEWATVRVTAVEKRFARAVVLSHGDNEESENTFTPSPSRVVPHCPVFELCGGCQLQHFDYADQLAHKRQVVVDALTRIGHLSDIKVADTIGMTRPWRYRNQVQVPLSYDGLSHRYASGFFASGSHTLIPTEACHLISESMEATLRSAVSRLSTGARSVGDLGVHHIILRESQTTSQQMVVFVLSTDKSNGGLVRTELESVWKDTAALPAVDTVAFTVQPRRDGPVWGRTVEVVHGQGFLVEKVLGLEYLISPRSFFQTNTTQASVLYEQALQMSGVTADDTVLDAYCGTGTMSLLFARHAKRVIGIESIAPAVDDARRNTAHNGLTNAEFRVGLVERLLPKMVGQGPRFDVAVLDPPRKGCDPAVLDALLAPGMRPDRLVYVSCNPATLARDLRILVDGGYAIHEVQPVDMFPQTSHVECVILMTRK